MEIILIFFFCVGICVTSIAITALVCKINEYLNKRIKINYTEDPCEINNFTIYQRNHFWERWYLVYSCQDLDEAHKYAKNLSKYIKKHTLPYYL